MLVYKRIRNAHVHLGVQFCRVVTHEDEVVNYYCYSKMID